MRSALSFGRDPNSFLRECQAAYGPVFTVNLGGKKMTFVTDPRAYPAITRARDGLSFAVVAAEVGRNVLGQTADYTNDQQLVSHMFVFFSFFLCALSRPHFADLIFSVCACVFHRTTMYTACMPSS
jgi:cytochrome P450